MPALTENTRGLPPSVRWMLAVPGALLILFLIAQLLLSVFLDDAIGDYLKKEFHTSTGGVYQLKYDDLDLSLWSRSAKLQNIHIQPDSPSDDDPGRTPVHGKAHVQTLKINKISLWAYLFGNTLAIGSVVIDRPVVHIDHIHSMMKKSNPSFSSVDSSLYAILDGSFSVFKLNAFEIRNGTFSLTKEGEDKAFASAEELNFGLRNIRVDSASARSGRLFLTDNAELDISGYEMNLPGDFYTVRLNNLRLTSSNRQLRVDSLQLIPRLPRYDFSAKKGVQTDRIELLIHTISLNEMDVPRLADSGRLYAETLVIDNTDLEVVQNMAKPSLPGRSPKLPRLAFSRLPCPVKIDTISIEHTDIKYTEYREGAAHPGSVTFKNTRASITGFSNYQKDLESNHIVTLNARTNVMGKGLLNTLFTFYPNDPEGIHLIEGNLGKMRFSDFNPALENLAFARMEGTIHSMNFNMKLNKEKAQGSVVLRYEDLNVELLRNAEPEQGVGKRIKSFITNTFFIKKSNKKPPLREGEIKFERDDQKSVFNYWWKALSTGLKDSIGL